MATLLHATVPRRRRRCRSRRSGRVELARVGRLNRSATPDDKPRRYRIVTCGNHSNCRVMCGRPDIRVRRTRIDAGRKARDGHGHGDTTPTTLLAALALVAPAAAAAAATRAAATAAASLTVWTIEDVRRPGHRAEEDGAGVHREDRDQGQHRRGRRGPVRPGDHLGRGGGHAAGRGRGAAAVRAAHAGVRRPARHRHGQEGRRRPRRGHVRGTQPRADQGRRQAARRAQRRLGPAAGLPQGPVRQGRAGRADDVRRRSSRRRRR